jgi:hypothetical protein
MPTPEKEMFLIGTIMSVCMADFKTKNEVPKLEDRLPLGDLAITARAHEALGDKVCLHLGFAQNATVWGNTLGDEDRQTNDMAMKNGGRILSAWTLDGEGYYVITEHDRSVTTIMRKEDY